MTYGYKIGGSLAYDHTSYVERQGDRELLAALQSGQYCYVLNSRQMGKSSLRVRTTHRLQEWGACCVSIDLTKMGSNLSLKQWYNGIIRELVKGFRLTDQFNLKPWLQDKEDLAPAEKLSQFLEEILLVWLPDINLFVFIDEVDKVLSLDFSLDEFFALIRFCYNQRAENPAYNRLTFALFGVATPSDLIVDKSQTPFNIGQPIDLSGFQVTEVYPLAAGLQPFCDRPEAVLREILYWTGGQPFLTQKLCQIATTAAPILAEQEGSTLAQLVRSRIINHWESQDEPVHFKTIRDRLLTNEKRAGRLLGLYQQILQQGKVAADSTPEQMELRLSGLVVEKQGYLSVYNPIYAAIFHPAWVNQQLERLRPYSEAFSAWLASNCQDDSRLLRGQALQDALTWASDKSLSDRDYQFLKCSQEKALTAEKQANQILSAANRQAKRTIRIGTAILIASLMGAALVSHSALSKLRQAQLEANAQRLGDRAWQQFKFDQIEGLLLAMEAGEQLQTLVKDPRHLQTYPTLSPLLALQQILDSARQQSQLQGHAAGINDLSFSPNGRLLATASRDGTAKLWNASGQLQQQLPSHGEPSHIYGLNFSPDGKKLAIAPQDGQVEIWNLQKKTPYSVVESPRGGL
ncbi:MAG: hypothetical protein HC890_16940 [Chloroflexaceae bacterium]|nr:hypothetical protein [Chloroflexaceae bacterium]